MFTDSSLLKEWTDANAGKFFTDIERQFIGATGTTGETATNPPTTGGTNIYFIDGTCLASCPLGSIPADDGTMMKTTDIDSLLEMTVAGYKAFNYRTVLKKSGLSAIRTCVCDNANGYVYNAVSNTCA
jgi:hypothetical protein